MDSQSAPVVSAAKLPIPNPNEFDLWKMRTEQYFLMTDYSLWEVIINGEQKLARKNELKARGTLLMALPDKHQWKFNSHKDAKTLMEAIEKRFGGNTKTKKFQKTLLKQNLPSEWKTHTLIWRNKVNLEEHSLDNLFNSLKIYETEVRHSSFPSNPTQNLAFVSSSNTDNTTDSVSAATNNENLKQIDVDDLEEIDLRWQMAMLTLRAMRFLQKTGRNLGDNRLTTMGFDMSKVECYNCHIKGHFARECRSPKDTRRREEEPANFALMAIPSSSSSDNEENTIVLKNKVEARDNFILTLKQKLKQAETERDDLKLKFEKFQSSSKSLTELIASQTNNKHGLGYLSSEDDSESVSLTCPSDRSSPSGGYHAVPSPITGNFMPPKPDLVFNTTPLAVESDHSAFNLQVSPAKPAQAMSHTTKSMDPIIEDRVFDSEDESKPNDPQSVSVQPIEVPILAATPKPTIKTSSSGKRKNRKTCFVCKSVDHLIKDCNFHVKPKTTPTPRNSSHMGCNNQYASFTKKYPQKHKVHATMLLKSKTGNPQYALKDKGVIDSGCSRHITGNMSYLSNFQELNGGYVSFGGTGPTWLFDIDSLTKTMNYQPVTAGNQTNPSAGDTAFAEKEHDAEKPESAVNLSPSKSALSGEKDDMTKKKDKGKSLVECFLEYRDLNAVFEDFFEDSSNDVSAASPIVPTAGQNYSNSTNSISAAGPIVNVAGHNYSNSSNPISAAEREDIVYSNHENVGAEADFNHLETSITVSPIPTTRIHNAHPISQIIGNLSLTTQTRSMSRITRDQGGILQILNEDFHTCMFACFLSQEEPKRIYVDDIIFGATNKDLCNSFEKLMKDKFQMSSMGELTFFLGLQVKQKEDGIFINQDKYVAEILKKFGLTEGKSASTPIDTEKPLLKDPDGEDVDMHIYRSMIGSLMYLTSLRPDIMFAVCACVRFQVTPKVSHLHAVKNIFRYLKGKPNLGLWYPKDSPFDLVAYSNSDYAGASLDKKSTTGGCQFLGCRLISWQYKKQTVVATSSTEAEYVAGASCCTQVLWIQNQMLDYGLQALVDKKRVVVTEAAIRDALHLDDAEGVNCLPNEEIFTELACMGYDKPTTKLTFYKAIHIIIQSMSAKRTSWNEFSSAMASDVICLSTGDLLTHSTKYISPALTQKVFENMRRVGKGCSGVETPLFEGMLVAREPEEQGDVKEQGNEEEQGNADTTAKESETAVLEDAANDQPIPSPTPLTPTPQQP
nr:uncharacterized mitochondrial protein AtMg00810-like [Tanacetum cinerariifolium]